MLIPRKCEKAGLTNLFTKLALHHSTVRTRSEMRGCLSVPIVRHDPSVKSSCDVLSLRSILFATFADFPENGPKK